MKKSFVLALALIATIANAQLPKLSTEPSGFIPLRLVRAKEIRSTPSVRNINGTLSTTNKHVLALTFRYVTGADLNGDGSNDTGGTTTQGEEEGGLLGDPMGGGGGGGTGGGGGGPTLPDALWLEVNEANEMAPQTGIYAALDGVSNTNHVLRIKLDPGDEVTVHHVPGHQSQNQIFLETGAVNVRVYDYLGGGSGTPYIYKVQEGTYYLPKSIIGDAAVDSRTLHGQPNREGQLPADPNAELQNVKFGGWIYKGGNFVGNMGASTNDRSGLARAQYFASITQPPQNQYTSIRMYVYSFFHVGQPSGVTGDLEVGLFSPMHSDTNIAITESQVSWETKWNIQPRTSVPQGQNATEDKDPMRKHLLNSSMVGEYVSNSLTTVRDYQDTSTNQWMTVAETPHIKGLVLAITQESLYLQSNITAWKYFTTDEFANDFPTGSTIFEDCAPRVWAITESLGTPFQIYLTTPLQ